MDSSNTTQGIVYGKHSVGTLDLPDPLKFLLALFDPADTILFRPIETWTEAGKKRSQVTYKQVKYQLAHPTLLLTTTGQLIEASAEAKTNIFFGVCPRLGDKGQYDLAWQIRKCNCLWADLDHCSVEEAIQRCEDAGLPPPSIIVASGNGVHLYWLLAEPYLIADCDKPPPIQTVWVEMDGKRVPRRFFLDEQGEEVAIEKKHLHPNLSDAAQFFQDVLAGLASKIGGDHTIDVSRLLRLPGSLNRKNERNGEAPKPCTLVKCEQDLRYAFADFECLAAESPQVKERAAIAKMPLPVARHKLSPSKIEKLEDAIARSSVAPQGTRSQADFGLCCFAIENGVSRDEVWSRVQDIGKFAEGGERYFSRTWERAETKVRTDKYTKLGGNAPSLGSSFAPAFDDFVSGDDDSAERPRHTRETIEVDVVTHPVLATLQHVTDILLKSGTTFSRASQCVALRSNNLSYVGSSQELAGHLNQFAEVFFLEEQTGGYRPLPAAYGNTWLNNATELARLPDLKLFTRNPVYTSDWRVVAPGYDTASGIYYAGDPIALGANTHHLDTLLRDFCFRSAADRTNYLAMLLTIPLVYHFIGSKPAVLFNGNQPGLGKSILAQILAILRDGAQVDTATYNPNDEEFEKRLGSIVRKGATTIIVDNAKSRRRAALIESACLERSITDPILSFRLLGTSSDIRAENSHLFCITANAPDVSRDLVTRSIVVNLEHIGDPTKREFTLADPEAYALEHRAAILGELMGMIDRWIQAGRPEVVVPTRFNKRGWGRVIGGILAHNGIRGFLANAEEAATEFDHTRREFAELVKVMHKDGTRRFTPATVLQLAIAERLLTDELGEGSHRSQCTSMGLLLKRYVAERFLLDDQGSAVLKRHEERKGTEYSIQVEAVPSTPVDMPNLEGGLPNLCSQTFGISNSQPHNSLPNLPNVAEPFLLSDNVRESITTQMQHTHVCDPVPLDKGSAGSARSAVACNHIDPSAWVARDGEARCPGCDRFMGKLPK